METKPLSEKFREASLEPTKNLQMQKTYQATKEAVEKLKEFIFNVEGLDHIGTKETQLLDGVITQIDKIFGDFK